MLGVLGARLLLIAMFVLQPKESVCKSNEGKRTIVAGFSSTWVDSQFVVLLGFSFGHIVDN